MPEENGAIQNLETPAEVTTGVATGSETNGADGAGTPASTEQTVPKWRMLFPDKWKKDSRLDGYNSLDEMMSGLFDGNTPQGTQTQEPAPAEPAEGDEPVVYSFSKQFPEGMDTDGVLTEAITQSLKEMKLTAEQADAVNSAVIDAHTRSLEAMKVKGAKNCENQLKQMWGDKYDENTALAKRATLQAYSRRFRPTEGHQRNYGKQQPLRCRCPSEDGKPSEGTHSSSLN